MTVTVQRRITTERSVKTYELLGACPEPALPALAGSD